jgi:hypothetical protein
MRRLLI